MLTIDPVHRPPRAAMPADAPGPDLPPAVAGSAGFLLRRAADAVRAGFDAALAPLGLPARPAELLLTLTAGPAAQHAVARLHGIDRSTMVAVVDDLEARGLVERGPDPADRRAHRLTLTKAGRAAARSVAAKLRQTERQVLAGLTDRQRAQLLAALKLIGAG